MRLTVLALALALCPMAALAASSDDDAPPKPTETTEICGEGLIWDLASQSCLSPADSTNDDSARLRDVRELAYAGRYGDALQVLDGLEGPDTSPALTQYGFIHRQLGQDTLAQAHYAAALEVDPGNVLALSYMGQGYVASGQIALAQVQLTEIRMRGARGTWAEASLANAIATGATARY